MNCLGCIVFVLWINRGVSLPRNIDFSFEFDNTIYYKTREMLTFDEAVDVCENQLSMYMLNLDTDDMSLLSTMDSIVCWVGLEKVGNEWYWMHYATNTGVKASSLDWFSMPAEADQQTVVDLRSRRSWPLLGVDNTEKYFAVCEKEIAGSSKISGYVPVPSEYPVTSTTVKSTSTMTQTEEALNTTPTISYPSCKESQNQVYRRKISGMKFFGLEIQRLRSLLSCAALCAQRPDCCVLGYSVHGSCYRLSEERTSAMDILLDCLIDQCYHVPL